MICGRNLRRNVVCNKMGSNCGHRTSSWFRAYVHRFSISRASQAMRWPRSSSQDPKGAVVTDVAKADEKKSSFGDVAGRSWGSLHSLIQQAPACVYTALQFFVAWQGVITIAYDGIPPSMVQLKAQIDERFASVVAENPGSKWPKTTLGCLRDGQSLSKVQLQRLHQICSEESLALEDTWPATLVKNLSVVVYQNCCLESTLLVTDVRLSLPADLSGPSSEQKDCVSGVMAEFSTANLERYFECVSKQGNRSSHYKDHHKVGVTLVHFLQSCPPILKCFKSRVEAALPGLYDWFPENTLHITVRAIG